MSNPKQVEFLEAYKSCHAPFVRYCSALAHGKMDAEDLVQDVLLTAYQHFSKIEKKSELLHYLIRGARNRSISIWRKKKYKAEFVEKHAERMRSQEVPADVLLDIQTLYKVLDTLPETQRDALILFEISGFSMKEIAKIQDSTEGAVKTKISRGRQKLKGLLNEDLGAASSPFGSLKTILL